MSEKMIWAYFLYLSKHMWADETTVPKGWYLRPSYTPENGTDPAVWDEIVRFLAERKFNLCVIDVGDGVQYDTHPEISAPDAWSKDFLKKKLDEMRALGIEPIPKLNFSAGHDTWLKQYRRMLSTEPYYQVCRDLIGEVCEVFSSPRLFHLGLDEEREANQTSHEMVIIRGEKLWWHDINLLFDECARHGARPWIWSDYFWMHPESFVQNMSRSVLVSNWYYGDFMDYPAGTYATYTRIAGYEGLEAAGFDQVPTCSTWATRTNAEQTMYHGKKVISPEHLKGYMTVPWFHTIRKNIYTLKDDAERLWQARQTVYPESL